jgi:hypothetical protein
LQVNIIQNTESRNNSYVDIAYLTTLKLKLITIGKEKLLIKTDGQCCIFRYV